MKFREPLKLGDIVTFLKAETTGSPHLPVIGINEIHMVGPGDVTFVDHPKYYNKALSSGATFIIINDNSISAPEGKVLIFSDDPFRDYVKLALKARKFEPENEMVSSKAKIGKNTVVQPGSFIGQNVEIGEDCIIHANVSIYDHCIIGNNVIIHSGSVLGADAYYFQKKEGKYRKMESCGRVVIKDNVEIGALCAIDRGVSGDTIIDEGTKLDNHSQIGHDTYIGKNCLIGAHAAIAGVTRIEDDVILWGRVAVNKDIVIGKGAVLLATSAVDKSMEGGKTYFGAPAIEVRKKWRELAAVKLLPDIINNLR